MEEVNRIIDKSGKCITIKPKDLRKAFEPHLTKKAEIHKISEQEGKDKLDIRKKIEKITDEKYIEKKKEQLEAESNIFDTPETIDIEKPGKYNIDIKGLLEEEPIIIQKDGSYTIHLPSIFEMVGKERKK